MHPWSLTVKRSQNSAYELHPPYDMHTNFKQAARLDIREHRAISKIAVSPASLSLSVDDSHAQAPPSIDSLFTPHRDSAARVVCRRAPFVHGRRSWRASLHLASSLCMIMPFFRE
ncbi:hypothetical protein C8R45DRAFT_1115619 [Mycena sanguinolenta]|nr:hypothetical protein C8R45DRAFT_1115619 [Mycena sanguinolenta]